MAVIKNNNMRIAAYRAFIIMCITYALNMRYGCFVFGCYRSF